jgi:hypothetical protein
MLEAAIVLQLFLGEFVEATILGVLLVFNAVLEFLQENHAQATLAAPKPIPIRDINERLPSRLLSWIFKLRRTFDRTHAKSFRGVTLPGRPCLIDSACAHE